MSILRKVLDNPIVEGLADIGEFTLGFLEFFGECVCDSFNQSENSSSYATGISDTNNNPANSIYDETYNYWMSLDYNEQAEYYHNNEYLQTYMPESQFYDKDRELTAKHVAEQADKLNRPFVNRFDRY